MKPIIRSITLLFLLIFAVSLLTAQSGTRDVVYLKNGSMIKGTILEMVMDQSIKIQTADGSIFVYTMAEVDRITKESASNNEVPVFAEQSGKSAGSSFVIYGGGAIPLGDFAKDDQTNENAGFAKSGWLAGAHFVTGGSLGFLIDASYSSNPTNLDKLILARAGSFSPSYKTESTPGKWTSFLLLAGVKIGTSNSTGANFFFAPLIGVNMTKTPEPSVKISGTEYIPGYYNNYPPYDFIPGYNINVNVEVTIPSVSKTVVVYGAVVEAILGGGITIGARYLACKPKYDMESKTSGVVTVPGMTTIPINETEKLGQWEPNISMAQIYLGFAL